MHWVLPRLYYLGKLKRNSSVIKETILVLVATILFNANKPHSFSVRLVFSMPFAFLVQCRRLSLPIRYPTL